MHPSAPHPPPLPHPTPDLPDALAGGQPEFAVRVRPVSKVEPTPPLRKPTWSTCTLPVVLMADYPYNIRWAWRACVQ